MRSPVVRFAVVLCLSGSGLFVGCSGAEHFDVAPVKGKVICSGKPVSEGLVQFAPVSATVASTTKVGRPGKSGAGEIQPDGTFEISTYEMGDGAVVGKCRVLAGPSDPTKPWACKLTAPIEFEVKPGTNTIVIEIKGDKGTISTDPAG